MASAAVQSPLQPVSSVPDASVLPSRVRANQGTIYSHQLGLLKSTPADTPIEEIRRLLSENGYVWVKNLLPREDVLKMRHDFFSQFTETGLLKPGSNPVDGLYDTNEDIMLHRGVGGGNPASEKELKVLTDAHTKEEYMQFVNHPKLRGTVRELMGWQEEVMLRRTLLRHNVPGGSSTGVHYDRLFLRGGDAFFLTAWVPIGDISKTGGGLYYLQDSVRLGQAIESDYSERALEAGFTPREKISAFNRNMDSLGYLSNNNEDFQQLHERVVKKAGWHSNDFRWLIADFEAGDVVFHDPCIIHGSLGNDDVEGRIRLSTDLRFYDKKDFDAGKADTRWMETWCATDTL